MSYDLRDSASLEWLRDYVRGVIAGTEARDALKPLAVPWRAMDGRLKAARDERDEARFAHIGAIRRYAVLRVDFLAEVTTLSGTAYLAAGKDADAPPYSALFSTTKAADFDELGFNNLRDKSDDLFTKLDKINHPKLSDETATLRALYGPLVEAGEARKAARRALIPFESTRAALVIEVEELGDRTEAAILSQFPGKKELVRAVLAPAADTGRADKKENEAPKQGEQ